MIERCVVAVMHDGEIQPRARMSVGQRVGPCVCVGPVRWARLHVLGGIGGSRWPRSLSIE